MKNLLIVFLLALLPSISIADMYGLGDSSPEKASQTSVAETYGLDTIAPTFETICFTWPNGRQQCFESVAEFEAATGLVFNSIVYTPTSVSVPVKTAIVEPARTTKTTNAIVKPYSSPSGYHRHVMTDGSVMEHHDSNYGDPIAHQGVAGRGWPKYYGSKAPNRTVQKTVARTTTRRQLVAVPCPTCPNQVRYEMRTVTVGEPSAVVERSRTVQYANNSWYLGKWLQQARSSMRWRPFSRFRFR